MPNPPLSSEEYDERAHQLYNEGQYDEALEVLREGLSVHPYAVELHIGVGYARLAREEYAWARRSFEEALILESDHEDALAGLGETLLRIGQQEAALRCFRRILELGYEDDVDLMLQVGRALFREGLIAEAKDFFDTGARQAPDMAEAVALVGYTMHRLGDDAAAMATLRHALQLDAEFTEARIYLANILYDRGDYEKAFYHLDKTAPDDHWDELGIWRYLELRKLLYNVAEDDPALKPWDERLEELGGEADDIDEMLSEIETRMNSAFADADVTRARGQLELFGAMLTDLAGHRRENQPSHQVLTEKGEQYDGSWDEIVSRMRDANRAFVGRSVEEFMTTLARRMEARTGRSIPTGDAESFLRASAAAGLLRIVR